MATTPKGDRASIIVRGDPELLEAIKARAKAAEQSISDFVIEMFNRELGTEPRPAAPKPDAPSKAVAVVAAPPAIPDDADMILLTGDLGRLKHMRDVAVANGLGVEHVFDLIRDPGLDGFRLRTIPPIGGKPVSDLTMPRVVVHGWKARMWVEMERERDAASGRNPSQPIRSGLRTAEEMEAWRASEARDPQPPTSGGSRLKGNPSAPGRKR